MRLAIALALTLALLSGPGAVHAAPNLFTPPLEAVAGDLGECRIANVSNVTRTVSILMRGESGTTITSLFSFPVVPFGIAAVGAGSPIRFYCQFAVSGSTKTVRASAAVLSPGGTDKAAVPAQ